MIEKITFLTPPNEQHKLIVAFEDGTIKEYTQVEKEQYLVDYPDRIADIIAMGWNSQRDKK